MPNNKPIPTKLPVALIFSMFAGALVFCGGCAASLLQNQTAQPADISAKTNPSPESLNRSDGSILARSSDEGSASPTSSTQTAPVQSQPIAPTIPASHSVPQISSQDFQTPNAQPQFGAMQAGVQAPPGRTYATPPHPFQQNFPLIYYPTHPQGFPPNMNCPHGACNMIPPPQAEMYQATGQPTPFYAQPFVNQQPVANHIPEQIPSQPRLQGPDETRMVPTQESILYEEQVPPEPSTESLPPPHDQTLDQATSLPFESDEQVAGSGSGHLANGMNMIGTILRKPAPTATQSALELRDQNQYLRQQLKKIKREAQKLARDNAKQLKSLDDSNERLNTSNRLAASLREKIAELNVKVRDLEKEKVMIEINADKALKEIESELDAMLLKSLSQLKE